MAWPEFPLGRALDQLLSTATPSLTHHVERMAVNSQDLDDISATLGGDGGAFARLIERYQDDVARIMEYQGARQANTARLATIVGA